MKEYRDWKIIGVDTGYGNVKTANCCFPAGLSAHSAEPAFKDDLLIYDGMYYQIGTGHKEFAADKTRDDDYYTLTLAAIARELELYGLVSGKVRLAVGLPLTWVSQQREDFKAYLMRSREVSFTFRGNEHHVYQRLQACRRANVHGEIRHPSVYAGRPGKRYANPPCHGG